MKLRGLPALLVGYMSRHAEWYPKGALTADMEWKHPVGKHYGKRYLPETVGRALRDLEEQGIIAVKPDGISVQYRWIPHALRSRYIRMSERPVGKESIVLRP